MIQAMIKCFERSTVERIEENSNDMSPALFIYMILPINTHKYGHGEMRNKKLVNRRNDIIQGWQSAVLHISLEKEGEKKKKKLLQHGIFEFGPSTNAVEQGLTLLSKLSMLLSLWYSDYTAHIFILFLIQKRYQKEKKISDTAGLGK